MTQLLFIFLLTDEQVTALPEVAITKVIYIHIAHFIYALLILFHLCNIMCCVQFYGEGNESLLSLGEWFQYQVDFDLPLLSLPYNEKNLMFDINTQHPIKG